MDWCSKRLDSQKIITLFSIWVIGHLNLSFQTCEAMNPKTDSGFPSPLHLACGVNFLWPLWYYSYVFNRARNWGILKSPDGWVKYIGYGEEKASGVNQRPASSLFFFNIYWKRLKKTEQQSIIIRFRAH